MGERLGISSVRPAAAAAAGRPRTKKAAGPRLRSGGVQWSDWVVGALLPVLIVIGWQMYFQTGKIDPFFLPPPTLIGAAFLELGATGELFVHIGISMQRTIIGFVIGGSLGLLFGLLVGFSQRAEKLLDPTAQLLRLTPNLAIAPLFILWFGFGEVSKVLIIANGAFFPMYVNAVLGIRSVDNKLIEVSKALEYSTFNTIRKLILPASLPQILLGVRLSLAVSWLSLVVAELINSREGIGYLIYYGQYNTRTELIFVGIIIFALVGKVVDSLVRYLERRLLRWRDAFKG